MTTSPVYPAHVPVIALTRGEAVESIHYGSLVILSATGEVTLSVGEPQAPVFSRSSLKPVQALAMLRAGLKANPQQVTLACASHSGQDFHLDTVRSTLASVGLDETYLRNTPDLPLGEDVRKAATIAGQTPTSLCQNCSGKHAAMLATCVANNWDLETYLDPNHPLQLAIIKTVQDVTGEPVVAITKDGCGAPVFQFSLTGLARAYAHIARTGVAQPESPEGQIYHAIVGNPQYIGGTGRDVTDMMRAFAGLITKDGAEGVQAGAFADGTSFALKISDGSNRGRTALALRALELMGHTNLDLEQNHQAKILGHGQPIGKVINL